MQKRRTEDAVHVVMTDHLIRRKPLPGDLTGPISEKHDRLTGPVKLLHPSELPNNPESRLYVAAAQVRASANLSRDVLRLRDAVNESRPTAAEPYIILGETYQKLGQRQAAIAAFQSALERDSEHASVYVSLANLLLETNRTHDALSLIANGVKKLDGSVPLLNSLSVIYMRLTRFDSALEAASKALRIDSEDPVSWLNFGVCLHAKGDKKGAEAAYRRAILLQPDLLKAQENLKLLLENQL
jgi:tetratricopeptide (TPR) repeat protein